MNKYFRQARRAVADLTFERGEFAKALDHYKECGFLKPRVIETFNELI